MRQLGLAMFLFLTSMSLCAQGDPIVIEGHIVSLIDTPGSEADITISTLDGVELASATADEEGYFKIEGVQAGEVLLQTYILAFEIEKRILLLRPGDHLNMTIGMSLARYGDRRKTQVSGQIRDSDGGPIPGAIVVLRPSWNPRFWASGTTDRYGHYSIDVFTTGLYELQVRDASLHSAVVVFRLPSFTPQTIDVQITDDVKMFDLP